MKRVRAKNLVLVNWKGIFYERCSLDENVTALEGDNGAGKTTFMVAAYVVLLPDMTRLRFTNVGESDATGGDKGVWGRLGNPNRPSYAVIVFDLGGEQVLAGVHLERKGEPSVELTPFLIFGVQPDVHLQDILLLKTSHEDLVPELNDLRENVGRFGGRMKVFHAAKDYFSELFERGITPLRLVADAERTRFNDMLRTSMTGGISRALNSGFRSFLLKEESGLADTLVRMRSNLEACRRTRSEVKDSQELEREISGVYEAGLEMFGAALMATKERAEELRRRVEEAKQKRDAALYLRNLTASKFSEKTEARKEAERRLEEKKAESDLAQLMCERVTAANATAKRITEFDRGLLDIASKLEVASSARTHAQDMKTRRTAELRRAEETYRFAAEGMADLSRGLEELHRRADAHRMVMRRLDEARATLDLGDLAARDVEIHEAATKDLIQEIDRKRSDLDAETGRATLHRINYETAMQALSFILKREVLFSEAHAEARRALQNLSYLEAISSRVESSEEELQRARALLERQQLVRARAEELSHHEEPLASSRDVRIAHDKTEAEMRAVEELARNEDMKADECRRLQKDLLLEQQTMQTRAALWQELDSVASRLEACLGGGLRSARELEVAREILDQERDDVQRRLEELRRTHTETRERARNLEETGGVFHGDLLVARDLVEGELLATYFDEVDPAQAGRLQAHLGPLAEAIVVEKPREAANVLAGRSRELESIWLVEEGGLHKLIGSAGADSIRQDGLCDVIVEQEGIVRTTRVPSTPTLGNKARQILITELRAKAEELENLIGALETQLGEISSRRRDTALLTKEIATLELGDPARKLAHLAEKSTELEGRLQAHLVSAREARSGLAALSKRTGKLRGLLEEAHLLDESGLESRVSSLEKDWNAAVFARKEIGRVSEMARILGDRIDALKHLPHSEAELESMRGKLVELGKRREKLFLAMDALSYVAANREALAWTDAEESLSAKQELIPSLKAQCDKAQEERHSATEAEQAAEAVLEKAKDAWRAIDGERSALYASRTQAQRELDGFGIDDPTDSAVKQARAALESLKSLIENLGRLERDLDRAVTQLGVRLEGHEASLRDAEEHLVKEDREWKPAEELWQRLRARSEEKGLLTPAITSRLLVFGEGSVNLRSDARRCGALLDDRLSTAKGGQEIIESVRSWLSGQELTTGDDYLQVWYVVRDWLLRRVPAQVAEVDDPLEALERLRHHLKSLGDRLEDQERKLRGASEDIARGIDVHIRTAQHRVRQLNQELDGVHFGTIREMRIRLSRNDRMEGVLRALREGSAQQLLFSPTMPVEEALEALFTRYGGSGGSILGQKLLDYREYVDITVEIQRRAGGGWEHVSPSRLSTGEAIGVGSALMMVVLTAWERDTSLFRAKRSLGTLRLLFLDEANRLSQDNLDVLFELCTVLKLQLIIAAPEVAHAPGCTTYRLVRRETADGAEEVIVSGRRVLPVS